MDKFSRTNNELPVVEINTGIDIIKAYFFLPAIIGVIGFVLSICYHRNVFDIIVFLLIFILSLLIVLFTKKFVRILKIRTNKVYLFNNMMVYITKNEKYEYYFEEITLKYAKLEIIPVIYIFINDICVNEIQISRKDYKTIINNINSYLENIG